MGSEACLTSNLQSRSVPDLSQHPIHTFLAHDIKVCLNTDDPAVQGIELRHEYSKAAKAAGLTFEHVRRCQEHALEMAFMSKEQRARLAAAVN